MAPRTPTLPDSFFNSLSKIQDKNLKIRWYMCVIVNLSSNNYSDVIPQVYSHFDKHLLSSLPEDERFHAVECIREGLIKSFGIVGAARTGNGIRTFADCLPESLAAREPSVRAQESEETAIKRGNEFFGRVYDRNPLFKVEDTRRASPDYLFVVKDIIYGRVFSFGAILDDLTSAFAMVSALYGMDSPGQLRNHMIGMQLNGATKESLKDLQELMYGLAEILGVKSRYDPLPIPDVPQLAAR